MNESTKQQTCLRFDELENMNHAQVPFTRERGVTYRYTGPKKDHIKMLYANMLRTGQIH